jgi:hypothetical protein
MIDRRAWPRGATKEKQMSNTPLHRGAVHEAGHAVMAHLLKAKLGPITIDLNNPCGDGRTDVIWPGVGLDPEDDYRVAGASSVCLFTFGFDISLDEGTQKDQARIVEILADKFPDDEVGQNLYMEKVDGEIVLRFEQPDVRAAVKALVAALMRVGRIEGAEAQAIVDHHLPSQD